jgi:2-oxoisovalerate dehydrogenase E1 component alpha subunit
MANYPSKSIHQCLNHQGELITPSSDNTHKKHSLLVDFYEQMLKIRYLDSLAVFLHRTGQLGTYPSCLGQEAIGTALAYCMKKKDVFLPYYRDQATLIPRGTSGVQWLNYWKGRSHHIPIQDDFPICIPIGTQCPHAVGAALALKYLNQEDRCVFVSIGDGGTSRGDFAESLNFAKLFKLPIVFVVNNNQWAISTNISQQTSAPIIQKAAFASMDSLCVDGNDIIALVDQLTKARNQAVKNQSPTLIEAKTYRLHDHTTIDDSTKYRQSHELIEAWKHEPLIRLKSYLVSEKQMDETHDRQIHDKHKRWQTQTVDAFKNPTSYSADKMLFDHNLSTSCTLDIRETQNENEFESY